MSTAGFFPQKYLINFGAVAIWRASNLADHVIARVQDALRGTPQRSASSSISARMLCALAVSGLRHSLRTIACDQAVSRGAKLFGAMLLRFASLASTFPQQGF